MVNDWFQICENDFKSYIKYICSSDPKGASQMALLAKSPPANSEHLRDLGLIPESRRSLGGGHGNPLQHSGIENPMDGKAWWAMVHRVAKSRKTLKWLSMYACTGPKSLIEIRNLFVYMYVWEVHLMKMREASEKYFLMNFLRIYTISIKRFSFIYFCTRLYLSKNM